MRALAGEGKVPPRGWRERYWLVSLPGSSRLSLPIRSISWNELKMDLGSIRLELDEKIDRNLKAKERNALQVLSLKSK